MYPARVTPRVLAVQPMPDAMERDETLPRALFEYLQIGQRVTGRVLRQAQGLSKVEIDGRTVAMRLPQPVQTGATLKLRFAGHMPQPVFLLEPPDDAASGMPQLSQAARLLGSILKHAPERGLPTVSHSAPLLAQPTTNTAELALALRTALVRSGLFYESHLMHWAGGKDSLDGLMQEPQNRLAAVATPIATDAGAATENKPVHALHVLLSQQLQVLESPHFVWKGELWPGQPLEWQMRHGAESDFHGQAGSSSPADEQVWESSLRLALPQLGSLLVQIKLDARQVFSIHMIAAQPQTEPLLQQQRAALTERLAALGCTLQSLTVQRDAGA